MDFLAAKNELMSLVKDKDSADLKKNKPRFFEILEALSAGGNIPKALCADIRSLYDTVSYPRALHPSQVNWLSDRVNILHDLKA